MLKICSLKIAAWICVLTGAALGQSITPSKPALSFEVASIKPVAPLDEKAIMSGKRPFTSVDNAQVHIGNTSVMELVCSAYNVSRNHVMGGPAWLSAFNSQRFEVVAKMPEGATKEQVPEMLQTLLAERFKLVAHREKRDTPAYALTVGRGGPRLKEAAPDLSVPDGEAPRKTLGENGRVRYGLDSVTMERFAALLSRNMDRPVVDQTGLKGRYQVSYELDLMASANKILMSIAPYSDPASADALPDPRDSIFSSVKRLGLKLDPRVLPIDVIVIDHIERVPTEN